MSASTKTRQRSSRKKSVRKTGIKGLASTPVKIGLSLTTSGLLILTFPNFNQGWLAWGALIPLISVCLFSRPATAFALGLLSGSTALLGIFYWIFEVPGFRFYHALPLAIFYDLFPASWCAGISLSKKKKWMLFLLAPILWVALDVLKGHAGFLAFPWVTLAQSQHASPLILQMTALTGEYGLTFLIVLVNIAITETIFLHTYKQAAIALLLVGVSLLWGVYRLHQPVTGSRIKIAVVQPAIQLSERKTPEGTAASRKRMEDLTRKAALFHPVLIVWPETAVRDLKRHPELMKWIQKIARETHTSLLVGTSEFFKFKKTGDGQYQIEFERRSYNAAYFFNPNGETLPPYYKRLLLPFGEYLPLSSFITWPNWLIPKMIQSLPGKCYRYMPLSKGITITPIICWENLFPGFVKRAVHGKAQIVAHLVNDNWFGRTSAPELHNMVSVLRAVENHVPVIIASNTGPSEIIDPYGRILKKLPHLFQPGFIIADVPVPAGNHDP